MPESILDFHPLLRIAGRDPTALQVLHDALSDNRLPIQGSLPAGDINGADPYQVDTSLQVTLDQGSEAEMPSTGVTYAGMTPSQRGAFLAWSQDPTKPAAPSFQQLLVAHVEVGLLDTYHNTQLLHRDMLRWSLSPSWRLNEWLSRALLLALWLSAKGKGIAEWTSLVELPNETLFLAIGLQTLLHEELHVEQIPRLGATWALPGANSEPELLALRLRSVTESLGQPPLTHIRSELSDAELQPKPWRTAHRSLRFTLPQPDIRSRLYPLISNILSMTSEDDMSEPDTPVAEASESNNREWQLILEFGQSRSEYYAHVLDLAQRMPGYLQLMDEDRRLVHRILIRKRDMRRFWRIWDYVQNWSTTHVYVNGEELEQWKVWPYSQYLR